MPCHVVGCPVSPAMHEITTSCPAPASRGASCAACVPYPVASQGEFVCSRILIFTLVSPAGRARGKGNPRPGRVYQNWSQEFPIHLNALAVATPEPTLQ